MQFHVKVQINVNIHEQGKSFHKIKLAFVDFNNIYCLVYLKKFFFSSDLYNLIDSID